MAIVVEDGTGKSDAESYLSVEEFKTYADGVGYDYSDYTDTQIEQALRRGTMWFDAIYGVLLAGDLVSTTQALALPQDNLYDYRGNLAPSDSIAPVFKKATAEGVYRELVSPNSLLPVVVETEIIKSVKVDTIGVEYEKSSRGAYGSIPSLSVVDGMMRPWVGIRNAGVVTGRAERG
jgi:hypothetical protein